MKVVIINKSDATGGAAIVCRRLMEALRKEGVDARMLVCEKLTDSPFITIAASPKKIKRTFISERLKIFIANGFNRKTLFMIDTGDFGLPLWQHPLVKEADAVLLNWVNQGMLSLKGVTKILEMKKPVIWTMHDMWCMTGICHHAYYCTHYVKECGKCPYLEKKSSSRDLSHKIWKKKHNIYSDHSMIRNLCFVAVSNWLKEKSSKSSLLYDMPVEVIPNAFKISDSSLPDKKIKAGEDKKIRILFGAARLDDPIKGLDILQRASWLIKDNYPDMASNLEIAVFGKAKDPASLEVFGLPLVNLGVLRGEDSVADAYREAGIVVSASAFETLPGTLVEAQAYGCIPVCFNQGGQTDIIQHLSTGYIAQYSNETKICAENLVEGIKWAYDILKDTDSHQKMQLRMKENVALKFTYHEVAAKYISLIQKYQDGPKSGK